MVIRPWLNLPTGGHSHVICMDNLWGVILLMKILQKAAQRPTQVFFLHINKFTSVVPFIIYFCSRPSFVWICYLHLIDTYMSTFVWEVLTSFLQSLFLHLFEFFYVQNVFGLALETCSSCNCSQRAYVCFKLNR